MNWHEVADAFLEELEPETTEAEPASAEAAPREAEEDRRPQFRLGQVVSTPGALQALSAADITTALGRHNAGDWGDVGPEDWQENNRSLREGFRLLSAYKSEGGETFWIITEADRSATTVLLSAEY